LRAADHTVTFEPGNQNAVDCKVDGTTTQVKTYNLDGGKASAGHRSHGKRGQAYDEADGVEQFLEGFIVKSGGKYYLVHAVQPLDALLLNGVFAHDGYRGRPPSAGKTTISPPLQIFRGWLCGNAKSRSTTVDVKWLEKPAYSWRLPVEIVPGGHGIPTDWLEEAAQEATRPDLFPSEALLTQRQRRIEESDVMIEMAADRHATEQAAERAESAADRAEAAAASSSGAGPSYNNCNINVTINNNIDGDLTEPGAKRLKQATLSFLPAPR